MTFPTGPLQVRLTISVKYCSLFSLVSSVPFLVLFLRRGGLRHPLCFRGGSGGVHLHHRRNLHPAGLTNYPLKQKKAGEKGTWVNGRFVRNYKGTNRPADMDPDQWNSWDKKRKLIVKDSFLKYGK